jgi:NhaP-type Na+/H+ or K+/H+ antiporter
VNCLSVGFWFAAGKTLFALTVVLVVGGLVVAGFAVALLAEHLRERRAK